MIAKIKITMSIVDDITLRAQSIIRSLQSENVEKLYASIIDALMLLVRQTASSYAI